MKNLLLLSTFISMIVVESIYAQRICGSDEYLEFQNQNENIYANRQNLENKIKEFQKSGLTQRTETKYRIPVVVHIVMEHPNFVTDAQVQSQIDVLNEDFRALNSDIVNIPSVFQNLISDTKFEFYLAKVGPNCNGITRTTTNVSCFDEMDDGIKNTSEGGHDVFDPLHLLNIWVAPFVNLMQTNPYLSLSWVTLSFQVVEISKQMVLQ